MVKIKFIFVGKDDKFSFNDVSEFYHDHPEYTDNVQFYKIANNKENLTKVYNNELAIERADKTNDFLVFLHADVSMDFDHLIKHLEACKEKYDVLGLCGCQKFVSSQSPLNWFTGSIPLPQFRWGCVTHGEAGERTSFYSQDRENVEDSSVACIDGLCIIFGRKALESEMVFDEQFAFDFYDTDISFQTLMKYNLRLGVVVEKSLHHYSVGRSILTKEFLMHELDFRKKWNLDIPKNSPIERLLKKNDSEPRLV